MGNAATEKRKAQRKRKRERERIAGRNRRRRQRRRLANAAPCKGDIGTALDIVPDDMPDGAWMAMLGELTGMDAGGVADALADEMKIQEAGDSEE